MNGYECWKFFYFLVVGCYVKAWEQQWCFYYLTVGCLVKNRVLMVGLCWIFEVLLGRLWEL